MRKPKYKYLLAGLALCTIVLVSAFVAIPTSKSSTPWPFTAPTPTQLDGSGVTLSTPLAALPSGGISVAAASSSANAYFGGAASIQKVEYMHCADASAVPNIDQDCYVVAVDPSVVPIMGSPQVDPKPATWAIVLVDPVSGNVIEAKAANN